MLRLGPAIPDKTASKADLHTARHCIPKDTALAAPQFWAASIMNMDSRRFRHDLQPNLLGSINCGGYLETIIEDSKVYAKPWFTFAEFTFKADTELLEFICGEKDSQYLVGK